MKRILIALAVILSLQVADAQVKSPEAVKKAVEGAEAAAQNPKKNIKPATWIKLAESYMEAYNNPAGAAWVGASKQELQLILAGEQPLSVEVVELNGVPYTKESFATRDYYYNQNGVLEIIKVTKPIYENALAEAVKAYAKANGHKYADYFSVMDDGNRAMKVEYQKDPVHPNLEGYKVMEEVIQKVLK